MPSISSGNYLIFTRPQKLQVLFIRRKKKTPARQIGNRTGVKLRKREKWNVYIT